MPELPEVQTTVDGINKTVQGLQIVDVWTNYDSPHYANKEEIKNPLFFKKFKKIVIGAKIKNASRKAKNILIELSNDYTILIHMKMTGMLCMENMYLIQKVNPPAVEKVQRKTLGLAPKKDHLLTHLIDIFDLSLH